MKKIAYVCCIIGTVLFVNGCANQNAENKKEIKPPVYMDANVSPNQTKPQPETNQSEPQTETNQPETDQTETDQTETNQPEIVEFMAYIRACGDGQIGVDEVEWVEIPSSRAEELNITLDDAPSGFSVYNPEVFVKNYPLAAACKIQVLDWHDSYVPIEISAEQLAAVLTERGEMNDVIPYEFVMKNGEVTEITEHYVP